MTARLPQAEEGLEDFHARALEALFHDHVVDLSPRGLQELFVHELLVARERAGGDALDFLRQVAGDFLLQPPHEERVQLAAQFRLRSLALGTAGPDGQFVMAAEMLVAAEVAGHQEIHDRPQVGHAVLDRRAGQHEPVGGLDLLRGDGVLRGAVLDVLGFVEDCRRPLELLELLNVAAQEGVGGDDEIGVLHVVPLLVPLRAAEDKNAQGGNEATSLVRPVLDQARGADDQRGLAARRRETSLEVQPGERLERFAEAHLVGQDTPEAAVLEKAEPVHAVLLVGTERTLKRGRERNRFERAAAILLPRSL